MVAGFCFISTPLRVRLFKIKVNVDTKLKRGIAEQAALLHTLRRGWEMLKPVGAQLAQVVGKADYQE